jgi:CheY-like chemotaxis protein
LAARILVIEDNPTNMELMVYLLKAYGHEPLSAFDGCAGIEAACRTTPELIICDIHLPQLDGYEVIAFLKQHAELRRVPAIAVTALAMVGDQEKLLAAGFDDYLSKPIDPEHFVATIERFLQRQRDIGAAGKPHENVPPEGKKG